MHLQRMEHEYWYGGCVSWGIHMPVAPGQTVELQLNPNQTPNQGSAGFVSSKGRWIWAKGKQIVFDQQEIILANGSQAGKSGSTLRAAYLALMREHFPFEGKTPAKRLFDAPIFNTWIELTFHQNQADILHYAHQIIENGFEPGVLMIDDGWSECYGDWRFHAGRFPDPRGMLEELHQMGFSVMLWVCPYVTPDSLAYRNALRQRFVSQPVQWWNGWSAPLKLAGNNAVAWLAEQLDALTRLGVDGFKFDGGDALYAGEEGNRYTQLWSQFAKRYPYNELRASWNCGGEPLLQRLCDKDHSWGSTGIGALIPDTLAQGITGYPFGCADMIGGGEYMNFAGNADNLDAELFVSHSAISSLMPAMQFSAAPWRVLPAKENRQIHNLLALRKQYQAVIDGCIQHAAKTGEPVIRYMEYVFPGQGLEAVTDQFMLGTSLLVAPNLCKGAAQRTVALPAGQWQLDGKVLDGGVTITLPVSSAMPIVLVLAES